MAVYFANIINEVLNAKKMMILINNGDYSVVRIAVPQRIRKNYYSRFFLLVFNIYIEILGSPVITRPFRTFIFFVIVKPLNKS